MKNKIKPYILPMAIAIAIPVAVGLIAALITKDSMNVYGELNLPPLSQPSLLFPIVWSILYVLMGVSSAIVYLKGGDSERLRRALTLYAVSLVLNFSWSIVFFTAQLYAAALLVLIALLYFIVRTIFAYREIFAPAAYLQIPYALWVAFAGYLNFAIWYMNR
jgi:tryptophan-rich sensory protein